MSHSVLIMFSNGKKHNYSHYNNFIENTTTFQTQAIVLLLDFSSVIVGVVLHM